MLKWIIIFIAIFLYNLGVYGKNGNITENTNMLIESHFVKKGKIKLYTELLKSKNYNTNKVCILISGAGAPAIFWNDRFCKLLIKNGYSVIRFDHRDQGLSSAVDWDKHSYSVKDLAEDVIKILDFYKISKAHIVGHSMGGVICQWLAINNPERLHTYTSISSYTPTEKKTTPTFEKNESYEKTMKILMENKPSQDFSKDLNGFMRSWKVLNGDFDIDKKIAEDYTKDFYVRSNHKVGVAWHHIWCQKDLQFQIDQLENIKIPGLFIHGDKDPLVSMKEAIEAHNLIPSSNLAIIKGMGHMFFNLKVEEEIIEPLLEHFNRDIFKSYDRISDWFYKAKTKTLFEKKWLDKALSYLEPNSVILDLGCGMGEPIAKYFIEKGFDVLGIDGSKKLIELAQKNIPKGTFIVDDVRSLDLNKKFDMIIAWHSIFLHLTQEEQNKQFTIIKNHMKESGILLFTSGPANEHWSDNGGENLYHSGFSPKEYKRLLIQNGFDLIDYKINDENCEGATVWLCQVKSF